ncbi:hypothetical protein BSZ14_04035 [Sphingomonas sp. Sph1(2015)]|jgi:hypothetical protein|uniref:ferritin-like domain-containing protein n=1 Tax=Sphingomonas sp. Sph1(2015) TaxID=1628084 RepID=UPI000978413B|nr:ferritin-like domain-containing protein [Sphingomonas sp. Sph1(2015)]OMJ33182.1 hypothetical protein BSZ14_04035 [Sphingomonas sp. Sph1(2015)]
MTYSDKDIATADTTRRQMIRWFGTASIMAGGLAFLEGCNDDVVGSESVVTPTPTASATATPTPPAAYTATDADRMNLILQLHYLYGTFLVRALDGATLPPALTTGVGTSGGVTGGSKVVFTDPMTLAGVNEVANAVLARIAFLRKTLGSAATAQPALNIAGGQNGPFDAIARVASTTTQPTSFFDPYASQDEFLLGAVALSAVVMTTSVGQGFQVGATTSGPVAALVAGIAASDGAIRNALYQRAILQKRSIPESEILFERSWRMAEVRDRLDGPVGLDRGIGSFGGGEDFGSQIQLRDNNWIALRRTPEQALGILYASGTAASSGGFFPGGVNGLIKTSGNNVM